MRVALTGATGIVGGALLNHLLQAGHEVTALARSAEAAAFVSDSGALAVEGDILDPGSLAGLVSEAEWVFHVAGVNQVCSSDPGRMMRVNVEGTRNVVTACREAGAIRLIHTSSTAAIGQRRGEFGSEVTTHRGEYRTVYEKSKHQAELVVLEAAQALDVVVVSPASVQGPGRASGTAGLIIEALRGKLRYLLDTTFSIVDIDDCARGHILAAEKGDRGGRYVLSGAVMTIRDALPMFASAAGVEVDSRFVPLPVAALGASVVELIYRLSRRQPPICREMVRVVRDGSAYDGSLATRELGLDYTPISETIVRTVEWFREEGYLD